MKILSIVHAYPDIHNSGAEWMLHEINKFLVSKGHSCTVLVRGSKPYNFEGVKVEGEENLKEEVKKCDIIISHLKRAGRALNIAEFHKKKYVELVHNSNTCGIIKAKHRQKNAGQFVYVVYNSEYTKKINNYPNPSIVVHPPVKECKIKPGECITLINMNENKGGQFFHDLARLMPDYKFLGIEGGYGDQIKEKLPNVIYMKNTPDIKKVYAKSRILLMPSKYESYGMTGVEAMSCGIPVIANPTGGLIESLGDAGIFCQLDSQMKWVDTIKSLDNEVEYKKVSAKCLKRAISVKGTVKKELIKLESFLNEIL